MHALLGRLRTLGRRRRTLGVLLVAVAGVLFALGTALAAPTSYVDRSTTVVFPQGDDSFADALVNFNRNGDAGATNGNGTQALGPPNDPPTQQLPTQSHSLGDGGSITLRYTDNALTGSGNANPDIYVFEKGSVTELVDVFVSTDGVNFTAVGRTTTSSGGIDIDDNGFGTSARLFFVRITDVAADSANSGNNTYDGGDIDAVGAIQTVLLNDAPVNTVPGAQTTAEDTNLVFSTNNRISIADRDAETAPVRVTVAATNGTLTPGTTTTGVTITGSGTGTLTLTGTVTDVNNALNGLTFAPNREYSGPANLTVTTNDLGNTGEGGAKEDSDSVAITVTAVNDVPQASNDGTAAAPAATVNEDDAAGVNINVLANDSGLGDGPITVTATNGSKGVVTVNANNTVTYKPNANLNGDDTFTYTVRDADGQTSTATVFVRTTPINDAPSFDLPASPNQTVDEDAGARSIPGFARNISAGPANESGQALTFVVNNDNNALFTDAGRPSITPNGTLSYTPAPNASGTATVTVTLKDDGGTADGGVDTSATKTFTITVGSVNDAPVNAVPGPQSVDEDGALTFGPANRLAVSDVDAADKPVRVTLEATNGVFSLSRTTGLTFIEGDGTDDARMVLSGTITEINAALDGSRYTPAANSSGAASLMITTDDLGNTGSGGAKSDTDTVDINVRAVNDAPVSRNDSYTTDEDKDLVVNAANGVLANDTDVDRDPLTAAVVDGPANGTLTLNRDGSLRYTPKANYSGEDSFTYRANDGTANGNVATVNITVRSINDAPTTGVDTYAVDEDGVLNIGPERGVLANDSDPEGGKVVAEVVNGPANGKLTLNPDGSFTYEPAPNFSGTDSFTYRACDTADPRACSEPVTVTLNVNAINDAPASKNDAYTTDEDARLTVPAPGVLANDTDADRDSLTAAVVDGPANGTLTLRPDGSFTYDPAPNFAGTDTFTYRANDGTADGAPATVTIRVGPVNDAPVAQNDPANTNEDKPVVIDAKANDRPGPADENGQTLTVEAIVSGPANGKAEIIADGPDAGKIRYTPNPNYNGPDSFEYRVCDNGEPKACNTATVNVAIAPQPDPPDAKDDLASTDEDTPVDVRVLDNDADPDAGDRLSIESVTQPAHGTARINANGTVTYTSRSNFVGEDTFTYTVSDGNGGTDTATVTVNVRAVNDTPVNRVPGPQSTDEDAPLVFSAADGNRVSVSDPDAGDNPVRVTLSVPSGALTLSGTTGLAFSEGDGTGDGRMTFSGSISNINAALEGLRFVPARDASGDVELRIVTNDLGNTGAGGAQEDADAVTISVRPVNDRPTIAPIDNASTPEDASATVAVTVGDTETPAGELVVSATSSDEALVPNGNIQVSGTGAERTLRITPSPDRSGETTITVAVRDADGATTTRTFVLTVEPVNDAPAVDLNGEGEGTGYSGTFAEDGPPAPAAGRDSLSIVDIDDEILASATVRLLNRPNGNAESLSADVAGTDIIAAYDAQAGVLTLSGTAPKADYRQVLRSVRYDNTSNNPGLEERRISFVVNDGEADSNVATSTLSVTPRNDAPRATNDNDVTNEDTPKDVRVLDNDTDPENDALSVESVTQPAHGMARINANGTVAYTPNRDYFGTDTFTYTVSDGNGGTATATATIRVEPVNDPPVARPGTRMIEEDQVLNIPTSEVLQNDSPGPDNEGDQTLIVTEVSNPVNGTVELRDGRIIFTPARNFNGDASFDYTACDSGTPEKCGSTTNRVVVNPVNDVPVAQDDPAATNEDAPQAIDVLNNDSAGPGEGGQVLRVAEILEQPANGKAEIIADGPDAGKILYTPNPDFFGNDTFVYRACDDGNPSRCGAATVTVAVAPANDAPVAKNDIYETAEGQILTIDAANGVLRNDSDVDPDDRLTAVVTREPASGTVTLNPDGSFTYNPNANFNGSDTFEYEARDGNGGTDAATVTITSNPVNDPPTARPDTQTVAEDATLRFPTAELTANDTAGPGEDDQTLTVTEVGNPTHGTVALRDGEVIFNPDPNFSGRASFTYKVCDSGNPEECDTTTVTVNVTAVNDAPVANADQRTIEEDQVLNFPAAELTQNDSAGPGEGSQTLTVTEVGGAKNGTVRLENGRVIFTPDPNYSGPAEFTYRVCDSGTPQECATSAVNFVQVLPVNDVPMAEGDTASTDEGEATPIDVLNNDSPGPNEGDQTLRVEEILEQPINGRAEVLPAGEENAGQVRYTPNENFSGDDTFVYRTCDNGEPSRCDAATVTVTVAPVNDAPENGVPGAQTVAEDSPLVFSAANGNRVSVSDPDAADNPVRVTLSAQNGVLTLSGTTGLAFSEGDGASDGRMTFSGSISSINAALDGLEFVPTRNYNGPAAISVTTDDLGNTGSGGPKSDTDTVNVTVAAVNDPPSISAIPEQLIEEDASTDPIPFTVGDAETAPEGLTVTGSSSNPELIPEDGIILGGTGAERTVKIVPARDRSGMATVTLTVRDADGEERTETFVVTVEPTNDAPVNGVPGTQTTNEDAPLVFSGTNGNAISVSDKDVGAGQIEVTLSVPAGTLQVGDPVGVEVTGDGSSSVTLVGPLVEVNAALDGLRFVPAANANGALDLRVVTNDRGHNGAGGPQVDEDTVRIETSAVNDRPSFELPADPDVSAEEDAGEQIVAGFARNISSGPNEDGQGVLFITTNDNNVLFAPDGQPAISPDGTLTYTPALDMTGSATVTVFLRDDGGTPNDPRDDAESAPRTFVISVGPVNDRPTISTINDARIDEDTATAPIPFTIGDQETPAADLAVVATSSNTDLVPNANIELGGTGAERTIRLTPEGNRYGTTTITLTVRDENGATSRTTFVLTVDPINDPPVAEPDDDRVVAEDETLQFPASELTANDSPGPNEDDQTLTVTEVGNAVNGTVRLVDGRVFFDPTPNYSGPASFEYAVSDGNGGTDTATVSITVQPVNDAPVANDDNDVTTDEESPVTINVLRNDTDSDGNLDPASVRVVAAPQFGTAEVNPATGEITYTPNADYNGPDTFTYRVCDTAQPAACSDPAKVTISTNPVGDAPVAGGPDVYGADEDKLLEVSPENGVLGNDRDADREALSAELVRDVPAEAGKLTLNPDGSFRFVPAENFNGEVTFEYKACDPGGTCSAPQTVTIKVAAGNDAPTVGSEPATTREEETVKLTLTAKDVDGDVTSFRIVEGPTHGTLGEIGPVSCSSETPKVCTAEVTYTPNGDYNGDDSFRFVAEDGTATSAPATANIEVTAVNDAPVAVDDEYSTNRDQKLSKSAAEGVLKNDTDVDGGRLEATLVSGPANGKVELAADGSFVYTPNAGHVGLDEFTYRVGDGSDAGNVATVRIRVLPVNDAPTAQPDSYATDEDAPLDVKAADGVLKNDADANGNALTAELVSGPDPDKGKLDLRPDGSFTFAPARDFSGRVTFTYRACDDAMPRACSAPQTATIDVREVNDAPVVRDDTVTAEEDKPVTINVLGTDSDDGSLDPASVRIVGSPAHGKAVVNPDGSITYTPDGNYSGADSFTYEVCDTGSPRKCSTARVSLQLSASNDRPVASPDRYNTARDKALAIPRPGVLRNDSDADGDRLTSRVKRGTKNGKLTLRADGSFRYQPKAGFVGKDRFTYTISDGKGGTATTTVTITIKAKAAKPPAKPDRPCNNDDGGVSVDSGRPGGAEVSGPEAGTPNSQVDNDCNGGVNADAGNAHSGDGRGTTKGR